MKRKVDRERVATKGNALEKKKPGRGLRQKSNNGVVKEG